MSMDPVAKEVWCEALESGEFEQGTNFLKITMDGSPRFCCLGVAMEVFPALSQKNCKIELLSDTSLRLLGLDHDSQSKLASMNDNGKTFHEISNYIREKL